MASTLQRREEPHHIGRLQRGCAGQTSDARPSSAALCEYPTISAPLVTCEAAIAEACYLLRTIPGAAEAILENVALDVFRIPARLTDQAMAVKKLLTRYRKVPVDLADACLVDLADQFGTGRILTLDRDFEIYRWRARRKFELLIELQ